MPSATAWKQFERDMAALFSGSRFWANSGEALDIESATVVGQCKLVKRMSLEALTGLAEIAETQGMQKFKAGVVCIKVRRGRGRKSPALVVMTEATWRALHGPSDDEPPPSIARASPPSGLTP